MKNGNPFRLPVLMYHDIHTDKRRTPFSIRYSNLSLQFDHLKKNGFTTLSMLQLLNYIDLGYPLPQKPVLITFDDGYKSIVSGLYHLLQQYKMKAIAFIVPSYISENENPEDRYLSIPDIKNCDADYIEWGIHSYKHGNYKKMTPHQVAADVRLCIEWFQLHGIPFVPALAFPFGAYPKYIWNNRRSFFLALHLAGIKLSFRIGNRLNFSNKMNAVLLERIDITGNETMEIFDKYLNEGKRKSMALY
jgi:peptidoglycan/xylan/chitin deacetylase (PgdA/CDA1 family)